MRPFVFGWHKGDSCYITDNLIYSINVYANKLPFCYCRRLNGEEAISQISPGFGFLEKLLSLPSSPQKQCPTRTVLMREADRQICI
jgi:hypothetical protein